MKETRHTETDKVTKPATATVGRRKMSGSEYVDARILLSSPQCRATISVSETENGIQKKTGELWRGKDKKEKYGKV